MFEANAVCRAVEDLEKEKNWYKEQFETAQKVIAQLHRGYTLPGEVTYIHPYDFAELVEKSARLVDVYVANSGLILTDTGLRFVQTSLMPINSKSIA